jgi:muramoyltetrapeptide carboxypeptidase
MARTRSIAVVAPAGIFDRARLGAAEAALRARGHTVVEGAHIDGRHRWFAGPAADRAADLAWALTAPGIDTVWFARGGSGTADLLAGLPWGALDGREVWGFSDATALFSAAWGRGRPRGVHAPVLHSLLDAPDDDSRAAVWSLLEDGVAPSLPGRRLCGPATSPVAPVVGGNLCVLASLCGTPWAPDLRGAILLLEDVGERPYRLDRLLAQLAQAGHLDGLAGVALGEFSLPAHPADAGIDLDAVFTERLGPLGVPVLTGLPVGHGRRNRPFVQGAPMQLTDAGLLPLPPERA